MALHPKDAPEKVLVVREPDEPSRRYHLPGRDCHHTRGVEGKIIGFEEAKNLGYSPCRRCFAHID